MICVTEIGTGREFLYTEEEYQTEVSRASTWYRALMNAIEVPNSVSRGTKTCENGAFGAR